MAVLGEVTNAKMRAPADACVLQKCGNHHQIIP